MDYKEEKKKNLRVLFGMRSNEPNTATDSFLGRLWMHHRNGEFRGPISTKMMRHLDIHTDKILHM